ncbi:MAG: tRNA (adenosine(37)-N6)-threonylcarbamoyltransferase complex dimerization subunit type 1 TsaB [Clostridiales bacterium]|nr:tRNA (adenosine(37)-N6)-threonylcarbamoyltransferase complex dimerization subunit type 1 TsaB [Clostridiales bacterium]
MEKNCLFINTAEGTRVLLRANDEYYFDVNLRNSGSETLMPMIDELLKKANISIRNIDVFGACIGPGSFTGLRIGLTTIKAFCYSLGKPCFGVNNLLLNSYNNINGKVISVADAGNNVCYIALYENGVEVEPARCVTIDEASSIIKKRRDYALSTDVRLGCVFPNPSVGISAREMRKAMETHIDLAKPERELTPLYIRKAQPERGAGDL